jgi:hypothetical protein
VTRQGDALIADALSGAAARSRVSASSGFIAVGTGWTGTNVKNNFLCNQTAGTPAPLDTGYPALKAAWGNPDDKTVVYRATFAAGALSANGINEAALLNGSGNTADCLAYAQLTPEVNLTALDTLEVVWEITIQGQ